MNGMRIRQQGWAGFAAIALALSACDADSAAERARASDSSRMLIEKLRASTGTDVQSVQLSKGRIDVEVLVRESIAPDSQLMLFGGVSTEVWKLFGTARAETVAVSAALRSPIGDRIERTTYFYYRSFPLMKEQ